MFGLRQNTTRDRIDSFIRDASRAGKRLTEIGAALRDAGWPHDTIKENLGRYVETNFPMPVPKPEAYSSPRVTLYNLIYFISLFSMVFCTVAILFSFLDYNLPDGQGQKGGLFYSSYRMNGEFALEEIRGYLATLIVSAPLFLFMHRLTEKVTRDLRQGIPPIRLWFISTTMFIGYITLFCNAVAFVNYFLSGELSVRFVIKVVILTVTVLGISQYYRLEMREQEKKV